MPLIPGWPLDEHVRRNGLSVRDTLANHGLTGAATDLPAMLSVTTATAIFSRNGSAPPEAGKGK